MNSERNIITIIDCFSSLEDPRIENKTDHLLTDIIVLAVCGVICGAEHWTEVEEFGNSKLEWFKTFLKLPNNIPSHDTFGRIFASINPSEFQKCFLKWIQYLKTDVSDEIISIDGKTLRKSFDKANSKAAIHMVSAWSAKNGCVLGQLKVSEKTNEIKAVPKLLDLLDISDCVVTMDAMGCQKSHAKKIIQKKGDYVLALKGNQKGLHKEVKEFFLDAKELSFEDVEYQHFSDIEKDHGRIENRNYYLFTRLDYFSKAQQWPGIKSVGVATYQTQKSKRIGIRYYISSLDKIEFFTNSVRRHWSIENELHWVLDVAFNEDECRVRDGHAPENFAVIRHIALNLLKKEKTSKVGIKSKRLKAGWDNNYLLKLLFQ